jgi:hypothetical protein
VIMPRGSFDDFSNVTMTLFFPSMVVPAATTFPLKVEADGADELL